MLDELVWVLSLLPPPLSSVSLTSFCGPFLPLSLFGGWSRITGAGGRGPPRSLGGRTVPLVQTGVHPVCAAREPVLDQPDYSRRSRTPPFTGSPFQAVLPHSSSSASGARVLTGGAGGREPTRGGVGRGAGPLLPSSVGVAPEARRGRRKEEAGPRRKRGRRRRGRGRNETKTPPCRPEGPCPTWRSCRGPWAGRGAQRGGRRTRVATGPPASRSFCAGPPGRPGRLTRPGPQDTRVSCPPASRRTRGRPPTPFASLWPNPF